MSERGQEQHHCNCYDPEHHFPGAVLLTNDPDSVERLAAALCDEAHGEGPCVAMEQHRYRATAIIAALRETMSRKHGEAQLATSVSFDLERLAALEHEQWEAWSRQIAAEGLTPERIERWQRYWVPYDDLDEATKEFDRVWARKVIEILRDA